MANKRTLCLLLGAPLLLTACGEPSITASAGAPETTASAPGCWQQEDAGVFGDADSGTARPTTPAAAIEAERQAVRERLSRYRRQPTHGAYPSYDADVEAAHLEALENLKHRDTSGQRSTWVRDSDGREVARVILAQFSNGWEIVEQRWQLPPEVCQQLEAAPRHE